MMERLHGAIRYLEPGVGPVPASPGQLGPGPVPASPGQLGPGPVPASPGQPGAGPAPASPGQPGAVPASPGRPGPGLDAAEPPGTLPGPAGPRLTEAGPFPGAAAADDIPVFHTPTAPWWDPGADTSVSPQTDHVMIGEVRVAQGAVVRMQPGARRADAQDLFLIGREAVVEAVLHDVDGQVHVAVLPLSDPTMAELQRAQGRFLYFAPDELEPVRAAEG